MVVERSFGLLKKRWKILSYLDFDSLVVMKHIVIVCCLMHNMELESSEDILPEAEFEVAEESDDPQELEGTADGKQLRNSIMQRMFPTLG